MKLNKKTDKEIIKGLKKEIEDYKEHMTVFSEKLYGVEMTIWEGGSGSGHTLALCKDIKDATLIKEGLKKTLPSGVNSTCGDDKIHRTVKIEVIGCYVHDVRDFVKEERW